MKRNNSSGYILVVLLVTVLLVAVFSVYLMNKLYFKQSDRLEENGLPQSDINQPANDPNAQNQDDAVSRQMNEIQKDQSKKLNDSMLK